VSLDLLEQSPGWKEMSSMANPPLFASPSKMSLSGFEASRAT